MKEHKSGLVVFLMYVLPMVALSTALSGKWYVALASVAIATALWFFPFREINVLSREATIVLAVSFFVLGILSGILLSFLSVAKIDIVPGAIVVAWFVPMGLITAADIVCGEVSIASMNRS